MITGDNTGNVPVIKTEQETVIKEKGIEKKTAIKAKGCLQGHLLTRPQEGEKHKEIREKGFEGGKEVTKTEWKEKKKNVQKEINYRPKTTKLTEIKELFEKKTSEVKKEAPGKLQGHEAPTQEKPSGVKKKKISKEAPGRLQGQEAATKIKIRNKEIKKSRVFKQEGPQQKMQAIRSKIQGKSLQRPLSKDTHLILGRSVKIQTHSDLKTKQGIEPNLVALKTQACMMSAISHIDGVPMEKLMAKEKSPAEQFHSMVNTIKEVKDLAKPKIDNKDNCILLTKLAGLINKGSGSGIGQFPSGWKWAELGDWPPATKQFKWTQGGDLTWKEAGFSLEEMKKILNRNDLTEKSLNQKIDKNTEEINNDPSSQIKLKTKVEEMQVRDHKNNENYIKEYEEMLDFLTNNYQTLFNVETRHSGGVELTSIQLEATLGQLVHDYVLDPSIKSSPLLKEKMIENGLINDSNFKELANLEKNMRNNPLLAEVPNFMIINEVKDALKTGETNEKIKTFLTNKLLDLAKKKKIGDPKLIEGILKEYKIVDKYIEEIGNLKTNAFMSGERGRLGVNAKGEALAGAKGESLSFAVMPNRDDDKFATEWNKSHLKDEKTEKFMKAVEGKESILQHGSGPTAVLRLGKGLDTRLIEFAQHPEVLLQKALEETDAGHLSGALLSDLAEDLKSEETQKELREIIGSIEVTFNKATKQQMPLGKMASMDSVASIMYKNDLRTMCSISGTTVDTVVGMMLTLGKEGMQKVLKPLFDYTEKLVSDSKEKPSLEDAQSFKEMFSGIAFFMQSGQYHSAAEVLGGLLIAARGLSANEQDNQNIDKTYKMFEGLMKEFSTHPEQFFAVDSEQALRINASLPEAKRELQERELERIKQK